MTKVDVTFIFTNGAHQIRNEYRLVERAAGEAIDVAYTKAMRYRCPLRVLLKGPDPVAIARLRSYEKLVQNTLTWIVHPGWDFRNYIQPEVK